MTDRNTQTAAQYDERMDPECISICDALNALPGIRTFESCCGHGERPFWAFFFAEQVIDLKPIVSACESSAWRVKVGYANGGDHVYFFLEGPKGNPEQWEMMAGWLRQ
jgi:hypothetical protein